MKQRTFLRGSTAAASGQSRGIAADADPCSCCERVFCLRACDYDLPVQRFMREAHARLGEKGVEA